MTRTSSQHETPFRINLEQQKKRAKELLKAFNLATSSAAKLRFEKHHPEYQQLQIAKLSDAQLVIAREFGLPSWAKLKMHIAKMSHANDVITKKASAADADCTTLHIRCGTDLQSTLPAAGFSGDFLEYSDPYGQGPVIQDDNFINTRAKFLHESYDPLFDVKLDDSRPGKTLSDTVTYLKSAHHKLTQAAQQYKRVVLWFEHDSFDQLILARLLSYFASNPRPEKLEIVSISHFPGSARFIGLGQLPPEAILLLWQQRQPLSQQQLNLGQQVWKALGESTPQPIYELMRSKEIKHLPNMHAALLRHLQELPSSLNDLSLTEQLTLEILKEESMTAGQIFRKLMLERDPLPWLGDVMYWFILQSMTTVSQPVVEIAKDDHEKPWHKRQLSITDIGLKVLSGDKRWLSLNPPARWLGGIKINASDSCWHWDDKAGRPVSM